MQTGRKHCHYNIITTGFFETQKCLREPFKTQCAATPTCIWLSFWSARSLRFWPWSWQASAYNATHLKANRSFPRSCEGRGFSLGCEYYENPWNKFSLSFPLQLSKCRGFATLGKSRGCLKAWRSPETTPSLGQVVSWILIKRRATTTEGQKRSLSQLSLDLYF